MNEKSEAPQKRFEIHYSKSPFCRTIRIDGVLGGASPSGDLQISIFNEKWFTPEKQTFSSKIENGHVQLDEEIKEERVSKKGVLREIEIEAFMSLASAKSLHKWLGKKILAIEARHKESSSKII